MSEIEFQFPHLLTEKIRKDNQIIYKPYLRKPTFLDENRSKKGVASYPTIQELALIARLAYKDEVHQELRKYHENGQLAGWRVLTVARNNAFNNHYFGIALWNEATRQIAFGHRGTKLNTMGSLTADLFLVRNKKHPQLLSAVTFVDDVIQLTKNIADHFFVTGHSLGGWLAMMTTYSAQYLSLRPNNFFAFRKTGLRPHTVVFDSPGAYEMLCLWQKQLEPNLARSTTVDELDITNYVFAPNYVNVVNQHVGVLIRINSDGDTVAKHNLKWKHSMKYVLTVFDHSGYIKPENCVGLVVDWPTLGDMSKVKEDLNPVTGKSSKTKEGFTNIRYQTLPFHQSTCSMASFTLKVRQFLKTFKTLPDTLLDGFADKPEPSDLKRYLNDYTLHGDFVRCTSPKRLSEFIPYVNKLVESHPLLIYKIMTKKNVLLAQTQFPLYTFQTGIDGIDVLDSTTVLWTLENKTIILLRLLHTLTEVLCFQRKILVLTYEDLCSDTSHLTPGSNEPYNFINVIIFPKTGHQNILKAKLQRFKNMVTFIIAEMETDIELDSANIINVPPTSWRDLTPETVDLVVKKPKIILQDAKQHISLQELLNNDVAFETVEDVVGIDILHKILEDQEVSLGQNLKFQCDCYIKRSFTTWQISEEYVSKPSARDLFVLKGISHESAQDKLMLSKEVFDKHYRIVPEFNEFEPYEEFDQIHFVQFYRGLYYLWYFVGSPSSIRQHLSPHSEISQLIPEEHVYKTNPLKLTILCGEPGLGKSTVLQKIAQDLKVKNPSSWIVFISLIERSAGFRNLQNKDSCFESLQDVIRFVTEGMQKSEQQIVEHLLMLPNNASIFLDGLDEISPDYKETAFRFIKALADHTQGTRIFVTTRNHLKEEMENEFSQLSVSLTKFSKKNQNEYLKKTLSVEHSGIVREMIQSYSQVINVFHIPLILNMFVSIVTSRLESRNQQRNMGSLCELYNEFVEKKIVVYKKKANLTEGSLTSDRVVTSFVNGAMKYHKHKALEILFPHHQFLRIQCSDLMENEQEFLKIGLITGIGETSTFLHLTFAEYFVAQGIVYIFNEGKVDIHKILLEEILVEDHNETIRNFLNDMLKTIKVRRIYGQCQEESPNLKFLFVADAEQNLHTIEFMLKYLKENGLLWKYVDNIIKILHGGSTEEIKSVMRILRRNEAKILRNQLNAEFHKNPIKVKTQHLGDDLRSSILIAIEDNHTEIFRAFYSIDAFLEVADVVHPLHLAVQLKRFEIFKISIEAEGSGLQWQTTNDEEETVVHLLMDTNAGGDEEKQLPEYCLSSIVRDKFDWTTRNANGDTAIHKAASNGLFDMLINLSDMHPEINACFIIQNNAGNTPVHEALLNTQPSESRLKWLELVSKIYPWTIPNNRGSTATHVGAAQGHVDVLLHLAFDQFLCLNQLDNEGNTPIHLVMSSDKYNPQDTWLEWVDHVSPFVLWKTQNKLGYTALHCAAEKGHFTVLLYLAQNSLTFPCLAMVDSDGNTPVHIAMTSDPDEEDARLAWLEMIGSSYSWKLQNSQGDTAVHRAARSAQFQCLMHLTRIPEYEECLSMKNFSNYNPMHLAISTQHCNTTEGRLLIKEWIGSLGNLIEWTDISVALHTAAAQGNFSVLLHLAELPNSRRMFAIEDEDNNTAVHIALRVMRLSDDEQETRLAWLRLMVDLYQWPKRNNMGKTAVYCAAEAGQFDCLIFLLDFPAPTGCIYINNNNNNNTLVHTAMTVGNCNEEHRLQWLLGVSKYYDWTAINSIGFTAVHQAVFDKQFHVLNHLMDIRGVTSCLEMSDQNGNTPVHLAMSQVLNESKKIWLRKVSNNFNWKLQNNRKNTAVHCAAERGNFQLLNFLEEDTSTHICLRMQNKDKKTPVHLAFQQTVSDDTNSRDRARWIQAIARRYDWTMKNNVGFNALHEAAYREEFDVLNQLARIPETYPALTERDNRGHFPTEIVTQGTISKSKRQKIYVWMKHLQRNNSNEEFDV